MFRQRGPGSSSGRSAREARTDLKPLEAVADGPQPAQLRVKQGSVERLYPLPLSATAFHLRPAPGGLDEVGELPMELQAKLLRVLETGEVKVQFTAAALSRLQAHSWPGNIRELRNVVHRTLLVRQGPKIDVRELSFDDGYHRAPEPTEIPALELPEGMTLDEAMQQVERQFIQSTLRRCGNHKEQAARRLGLARSSLFDRLKRWGLTQGQE